MGPRKSEEELQEDYIREQAEEYAYQQALEAYEREAEFIASMSPEEYSLWKDLEALKADDERVNGFWNHDS